MFATFWENGEIKFLYWTYGKKQSRKERNLQWECSKWNQESILPRHCLHQRILYLVPKHRKVIFGKAIAADTVSDGATGQLYRVDRRNRRNEIEFWSSFIRYDYSDFVEGLRPRWMKTGRWVWTVWLNIKSFTDKARRNFEFLKVKKSYWTGSASVQTLMKAFFDSIEYMELHLRQ